MTCDDFLNIHPLDSFEELIMTLTESSEAASLDVIDFRFV